MFLCEYISGFWNSMNGYWLQRTSVDWTHYHSVGLQFHESGEWSQSWWTGCNQVWQMWYRARDKNGYRLSQFTFMSGRGARRRNERDTNIQCNESIQRLRMMFKTKLLETIKTHDEPIPHSEEFYRARLCVCVWLNVIKCNDNPLHQQCVGRKRSD